MDKEIIELFRKHFHNQCTQQELERVMEFFSHGNYQMEWDQVLTEESEKQLVADVHAEMSDKEISSLHDKIIGSIYKRQVNVVRIRKNIWWKRVAVAALFVLMATATLYFIRTQSTDKTQNATVLSNDIEPGKMGATLTLANGKKIRLDNASSGQIAKETGVTITKTSDGTLMYDFNRSGVGTTYFNTLSTARGETYMLKLPDQSKVWLNAESSITFSTTLLNGGERKVKLVGEAYFEVAKDKAHPFIVESGSQEVKVLGTHFNVSAYPDEKAHITTLLEGSVQVSMPKNKAIAKILMPGQQSIVQGGIKVINVNPEVAVAWRNDIFYFNNESVEGMMRRLARWYDVDVEYLGEMPETIFYAQISRTKSLSKVLNLLEKTGGVHFTIKGRRIIVMK